MLAGIKGKRRQPLQTVRLLIFLGDVAARPGSANAAVSTKNAEAKAENEDSKVDFFISLEWGVFFCTWFLQA